MKGGVYRMLTIKGEFKNQSNGLFEFTLLSVKKNNFPCSPTTYGKLKLFSYQYIKKIKYT